MKWITLGMLVLQVALGAALPLAHARAELRPAGVAHVENPADPRCPPPHDAAECQVCRHNASASQHTAQLVRLPEPPSRALPQPAPRPDAQQVAHTFAALPRGPPPIRSEHL